MSELQKRATVSHSLRSLMTKEPPDCFSPFLCPRANPSCRFLLSRSSLSCSLQKSDHERNAPVALYIRAAVSDSLRLLITKKQQEQIALSLTKNERNAPKTDERIPNPANLPPKSSWQQIEYWYEFKKLLQGHQWCKKGFQRTQINCSWDTLVLARSQKMWGKPFTSLPVQKFKIYNRKNKINKI